MRHGPPALATVLLAAIMTTGHLPGTPCAAESSPETIPLPQPRTDGAVALGKALAERRSVRQYQDRPVALSDLSQLLWAAQGITGPGGKRTAPSAGALYPLILHVVAGKVAGLPAGIYSYDPHEHSLSRTGEGNFRTELSRAVLSQASVRDAAAVLVLSALYERTTIKYGERGIRYVHLEAGHAAQNVCLQAAALGLGSVVIGAFQDEQVRAVLKLRGREQPLVLLPVGKK